MVINPTGKSYVCVLHEYCQHAFEQQPRYVYKELGAHASRYAPPRHLRAPPPAPPLPSTWRTAHALSPSVLFLSISISISTCVFILYSYKLASVARAEDSRTPFAATVFVGDIEYGGGRGESKRAAKLAAGTRARRHSSSPSLNCDLQSIDSPPPRCTCAMQLAPRSSSSSPPSATTCPRPLPPLPTLPRAPQPPTLWPPPPRRHRFRLHFPPAPRSSSITT